MEDNIGNIYNDFNISEEELNDFSAGSYMSECGNVPPNVARLIVWLIDNYPHALIEELLTRGFQWPVDIPFEDQVFVSQDDTDGHVSGFWLGVSRDNDKWLKFEMQGFDEKKALRHVSCFTFPKRHVRRHP